MTKPRNIGASVRAVDDNAHAEAHENRTRQGSHSREPSSALKTEAVTRSTSASMCEATRVWAKGKRLRGGFVAGQREAIRAFPNSVDDLENVQRAHLQPISIANRVGGRKSSG